MQKKMGSGPFNHKNAGKFDPNIDNLDLNGEGPVDFAPPVAPNNFQSQDETIKLNSSSATQAFKGFGNSGYQNPQFSMQGPNMTTVDQTGNDTIAQYVAQLQKEDNDRSDDGDGGTHMNSKDL